MHRLSQNLFCDYPDIKDLTAEQQYALHEFFHVVLAAGYKLFQVVPAPAASAIVKKKFGQVIGDDDAPP